MTEGGRREGRREGGIEGKGGERKEKRKQNEKTMIDFMEEGIFHFMENPEPCTC
jgi:hypothetical protein